MDLAARRRGGLGQLGGSPLVPHEVVVELIATTITRTGPRVRADVALLDLRCLDESQGLLGWVDVRRALPLALTLRT